MAFSQQNVSYFQLFLVPHIIPVWLHVVEQGMPQSSSILEGFASHFIPLLLISISLESICDAKFTDYYADLLGGYVFVSKIIYFLSQNTEGNPPKPFCHAKSICFCHISISSISYKPRRAQSRKSWMIFLCPNNAKTDSGFEKGQVLCLGQKQKFFSLTPEAKAVSEP